MRIKDMCICSLIAILIAVGAFIKIPIGMVPITLQTLFLVLGAFLIKKKIVISVLLYLIMGLIGIPVFVNGGGFTYVLMPSFGYLIGFLFAGYYIGSYKKERMLWLILRSFLGILFIYLIGVIYFVLIEWVYYQQVFSFTYLFYYLFLIYLPGDLLSIIVAISIYKRIHPFFQT